MTHNPFDQLPFLQQGAPITPAQDSQTVQEPMTRPIPAVEPDWTARPQPMHVQQLLTSPVPAPAPAAFVSDPRPLEQVSSAHGVGWNPSAMVEVEPVPAAGNSWSDTDFDEIEDLDDDADRTVPRGSSALGSVVRKILGLDRAPRTKSRAQDADWLEEDPQEPPRQAASPDVAVTVVDDPAPPVRNVQKGPVGDEVDVQPIVKGRRGRRQPGTEVDGMVVVDSKPAWPARVGKGVLWVVVGLVFVSGINQLVVRPIIGSGNADVVEQAPAVDPAAAQAAAIRYSLDYFSYSPDAAAAGTAALQADLDSSTVRRWTGDGYLAADSAAAGPVVPVDETTALVPVTLRIRLATPPVPNTEPASPPTAGEDTPTESESESASASTEPTPSTSTRPVPSAAAAEPSVPEGAAGDPGQIPPGWTDLGARWVTVSVPVRAGVDGAVKATGGGAILVGEGVTAPVGTNGLIDDTELSNSTRTAVERFFVGYAASDTSYVSAPGVEMTGLNGIVTASDRTRWVADQPAADSAGSSTPVTVTELTGTAEVTWHLTGTDLSIVQTYRTAMTLSEGRWYVAELAPSLTNQ